MHILLTKLSYTFLYALFIITPPIINNSSFDLTTTPVTGTVITQTPSESMTPEFTSTPEATMTITPSPTLMPLPAITLIFPASTQTPTQTGTSEYYVKSQTQKSSGDESTNAISSHFKFLIGIVIILWILLAGYFILYIHQIK